MQRVRNRSVLENTSRLLLPHLLAPNEVKAQVFPQPAERVGGIAWHAFNKKDFAALDIDSFARLPQIVRVPFI